jgi:hypothetical protein
LLGALDAIARLRQEFPVLNPRASLDEVARYVRGEEQLVPCIGGYIFYIDWNLDIWRCAAWNEPMGSVFDLDRIRRSTRSLQRLYEGLLSQCQHVDARRRLGGRCGAGLDRRPDPRSSSIAVSATAWHRRFGEELPRMRRLTRRHKRSTAR